MHTAEFPGIRFDSIPVKLKSLGYHSMILWGGNPSFSNQLLWGKRWYNEWLYHNMENDQRLNEKFSDSEIIKQFLQKVASHDQKRPGQPFFSLIFSSKMHAAYDLSNQFFSMPEAAEEAERFNNRGIQDAHKRYSNMLRLMDLQIEKMVRALNQRKRKNNTVIIILGDHSSRTHESDMNEMVAFPMDHYLWTGALIYGPERLVGPTPRREEFPASQIDIMPTILAMIGDDQPTSTMGTDLFAKIPPERRTAIAVRPGGFRLDRGGQTLFVDASNPERFWATESFSQWNFMSPPAAESIFTAQDSRDLSEAVHYWSYLVENNRVWNSQ